jgi:frataxin-like iron-binding protein CyaY
VSLKQSEWDRLKDEQLQAIEQEIEETSRKIGQSHKQATTESEEKVFIENNTKLVVSKLKQKPL